MVRRLLVPVWLVLGLTSISSAAPTTAAQEPQAMEVFTRPGCIHCAHAREYLEDLRARRPNLRITERDVIADPIARERLRDLAARHGVAMAVPTFVVGDRILVGFADASTTGRTIEGGSTRAKAISIPSGFRWSERSTSASSGSRCSRSFSA
jgi:glutaredoxin